MFTHKEKCDWVEGRCGDCCTGCPKKIVPFSKILLFGGHHLENFVPMGTAGILIKIGSI